MASRRFSYGLVLLVCFLTYVLSGTWLAWLVLTAALLLPLLSLLISLPAIRSFRMSPAGVDVLQTGEEAALWLMGSCGPPMPPFRGNLKVRNCFTGEVFRYRPELGLSTAHCGGLEVTVEKGRVCDYLGLFSFRPRRTEGRTILIRPTPLEVPNPPDPEQLVPRHWHAKTGGGFSEAHELRPYRPGDSMTGIHWKLSTKTGSLMVREPMEPEQGRLVLTMDLRGTGDELDRKFGRLLFLGNRLLEQELHFDLRVLTGQGLWTMGITGPRELDRAVNSLLCQNPAAEGSARDCPVDAAWQYHIGGEAQ